MNTIAKNEYFTCPKCKSKKLKEIEYRDIVDFRGLEFDVENLKAYECNKCIHIWESKNQLQENQSKIKLIYGLYRDRMRLEQGLLSGEDIYAIRKHFELNQREAAFLFGGGYNAFNKYESGEVLQSASMDKLLRLTSFLGKPVLKILNGIANKKSNHSIRADLYSSQNFALTRVTPMLTVNNMKIEFTNKNVNFNYDLNKKLSLTNTSSQFNLETVIPA